ncbi:Organic cation transporter-like protein [Folsomia candida]|uniref:Organic cation transporter-like protein n=1 Tax=Folsomia candida TaxID=158441 RepID=A0A226EX12_FOLCA|nr:Organic cation transporter-like protein [Folsomia candida]
MKTKALGDFYLWDRCYIQELDADVSTPTFNLSELKPYIPFKDGNYETCKKFDALTNETIGCEQFVYDGTYYKESRVISWNLVCDQRWERAIIQAIYIFGVLVGAIVLGPMADKQVSIIF